MAKMSKTQRYVVLSYNDAAANRGLVTGQHRTIRALVENGWAVYPLDWPKASWKHARSAYVTSQGLIAAGFDMNALHTEAVEADDAFDRIATKCAAVMVAIGEAQRAVVRDSGARPAFGIGDTVIVGRGNLVSPPQYRVARIDEVNAQALIQPLNEADTRDPWWILVEYLVIVPADAFGD